MVGRKFSQASSLSKLEDFNQWLGEIKPFFKDIYIIGGNHDQILDEMDHKDVQKLLSNGKYIVNKGFEYKGLKFFATPLSEKSYHGTSKNIAFQSKAFKYVTSQALENYTNTSNKNGGAGVDVLITHGLCSDLVNNVRPKLHLYGHHHSSFGVSMLPVGALSICATIMDKSYNLRNPPVVIDIPLPLKQLSIKIKPDVDDPPSSSSIDSTTSAPTSPSLTRFGFSFGFGLGYEADPITFPLYSPTSSRKKRTGDYAQTYHQSNKVAPVDSDL